MTARWPVGRTKMCFDSCAAGIARGESRLNRRLVAEVGKGDVVLGRARRGDAQIEGDAQRHGRVGNFLTASAWPEQLVDQVTEPRFEHRDLGHSACRTFSTVPRSGMGHSHLSRRALSTPGTLPPLTACPRP